jgi:putative methyltransferase (TIGR04325 family)
MRRLRVKVLGHKTADAVLQVSAVRRLVELRYERQFEHWPGAFRGVYTSFAEAVRTAPPGKVGYDHPELAAAYRNRLEPMTSEYPVMFWLQRAFSAGARSVFDYGGHVGLAYYAFRARVEYPPDLVWRVCDLPNMVLQGRELAREQGAVGLTFTTAALEADGYDILYSQGALQYIDQPLGELLRDLGRKPVHLLLNQVPLAKVPTFVTLQNTIAAYTPYRIFNRSDFLESLLSLGYEVIDSWLTPELSVHIPLHPEHTVASYSGLYLRRGADPG